MVKFSQAIKLKNNLLTKGDQPIFNGINQAISNTSDLNANYISNNGLLIKLFNYLEDSNSEYLNFIQNGNNNFFNFFIDLMNQPEKLVNYNFDNNNNYYKVNNIVQKNIFHNLLVLVNTIATNGITSDEEINDSYNNEIKINTQGNYPSLIVTLMTEQLDSIIRNNLAQLHYQNKIPIIVPYGYISPYTLFKKLLYDTSRSPESYILNFGPSNFDSISAMFNFYKLNELRKINSLNKFKYVNSENDISNILQNHYNNYIREYPLPNTYPHFYTEINYDENGNINHNPNYIANFTNYNFKYNINLSNKYIFYLGIDNDYGWTNSTSFLKHIASQYYEILLPSYNIIDSTPVILSKNNSSFSTIEVSYNEYINSVVSDISNRFTENIYTEKNNNYYKVNNILQEDIDYFSNNVNPKVIAIKIPYYQSNTNTRDIGIGVIDAWHIVKTIIDSSDNNIDLNNSNIFLQSYGIESDKKTVEFLSNIDNSGYVGITFGSNYDFLEKNFNDVYDETNYNKDILNGLYSIKSYNSFNVEFVRLLNTLYNSVKEQTDSNITFTDFSNNFDQFKFFESIALVINIALYISNTIKDTGITNDFESFATNLKIPSGEKIFTSNKDFNYNNLALTQTYSNDGIIYNSFIFSNIISSAYNNGKYFKSSDIGYPFKRNPAFTLFRRDNKSPSQDLIDTIVKYNYYPEYFYNSTDSFNPIFINSDYDLINSLIFLVNSDTANYDYYYKIYLDNYLKNTTIVTTSGEYITIQINEDILGNKNDNFDNSYLQINNLNANYAISDILFGDDFRTFDTIFEDNNNINKIIIGRNIIEIPQNAFKNCKNLNNLNFILDSSCEKINSFSFQNCISLNTIKFPNSIKIVENFAFADCSNLSNLQLSDNLLSINNNAFQNTKITNLEFKIINDISYRAFYSCNDLSNVIFNDSCTIQRLDNQVFKLCTNLENITLCKSINTLGIECFSQCQNLNIINFDSNLTSIESRCFKGCTSLQNINLYNTSITILQEETFADCSNLRSCILPSTITEINNRAFSNCNDLSYIIINGSLTIISNEIFENINNNVIIYYFSSKTNTSLFNDVSNKILIDFDSTVHNYNTYDTFYPEIYVEKNSLFKLKDLSINFNIDNFIIPYDISIIPFENNIIQSENMFTISRDNYIIRNINFTSNKIDTSGIIGYLIKFGNNFDLSFELITNIIVLDNILNKPYIKYNGNRVQYIITSKNDLDQNIYNEIIDYGINCYNYNNIDISHILINNIPSPPLRNTVIRTGGAQQPIFFVNYYYVIDESNNYNIDYNFILFLNTDTARANLRIDNNYSFEIFNDNNITKARLTLRLENDGNIDVPKTLLSNYSNVFQIDNPNFLFPIFSITDISNNSADLTPLNGPIINQSYNLLNNSTSYYFTNRINSNILRSSELNIKNSYNNYEKLFNQKNGNSIFKKEESWGFKRGLYANDYAEIDIVFNYFGNCKDIINGKNNNIFTKDNSFGIFIDNATSSYTNDGSINFYNIGYFREYAAADRLSSFYFFDLYSDVNLGYNYNDNVIHFQVKNDVSNIIMNGPRHLIIEKNSYFEDFGVLYLDNITPSFEYYEFPINTYNSNSINLSNGIYEISYSIYPNGLLSESIDISRTIEIVNNNPYKPSIVLGNSEQQTILFNSYSGNNLENYAYDYNNNPLPLFSNLINYDLSQIGTYYEYFYTYDLSGNYASLTRTIDVSDNSFIDLNFRPNNNTNIGFDTEREILTLYIDNNGSLIFNDSIELNFKILHKEPTSHSPDNFISEVSFNYFDVYYHYDSILDSNSYKYDLCFNDISNSITTNIINTQVTSSDVGKLNILTNIPAGNSLVITIPIVNKTNNPIGVFINNVLYNYPLDISKIFVYENNTNLKLEYGANKTYYDSNNNLLNVYIKNNGLINKLNNKHTQNIYFAIGEITDDYNSSIDKAYLDNGIVVNTVIQYNNNTLYYKFNNFSEPLSINLTATFVSNIINTSSYNINFDIHNNTGFIAWAFFPIIEANKILSFSINNLTFTKNNLYILLLDVGSESLYGNVYEDNEMFNNNSDNIFIINYQNNIHLQNSSLDENTATLYVRLFNNTVNSMFYGNKRITIRNTQLQQDTSYNFGISYEGLTYYINSVDTNSILDLDSVTIDSSSNFSIDIINNIKHIYFDDIIHPSNEVTFTITNLPSNFLNSSKNQKYLILLSDYDDFNNPTDMIILNI